MEFLIGRYSVARQKRKIAGGAEAMWNASRSGTDTDGVLAPIAVGFGQSLCG